MRNFVMTVVVVFGVFSTACGDGGGDNAELADGVCESERIEYSGSIRVVHPQTADRDTIPRGSSETPLTVWETCGASSVAYWSGCEVYEGSACADWYFLNVVIDDDGTVSAEIDADGAEHLGVLELSPAD
ncbi:MAG: hypothetical protein ACOC9T_02755 [Myxococcota bacterium]